MMKTKYILAIFLFIASSAFAQMSGISVDSIPYTDPEVIRPGAGAESWHDQAVVDIPTEGTTHAPLDFYIRSYFHWYQLETTEGNYQFDAVIRPYIQTAISRKQKFGFGIMTLRVGNDGDPATPIAAGVGMSYPLYLHNLMQTEITYKDFIDGAAVATDWWVPNYNSQYYQDRLDSLHANLSRWLDTANYLGYTFDKVIGYFDIRGVGDYGEWHHADHSDIRFWDSWKVPLLASLERIVDSHCDYMGKHQLVAIDALFDCQTLNNTWNPPGIADYVLRKTVNGRKIGIRRDNWASTHGWITQWLIANPNGNIDGQTFGQVISNLWQFAPFIGEPYNFGDGVNDDNEYEVLESEIIQYHATSFGNGNMAWSSGWSGSSPNKTYVRNASKRAGYRLKIKSGSISTTIARLQPMYVTLEWENSGIAPVYENWNTMIEIRSGTTVIWSDTSKFVSRLFLPGTATIIDTFDIPGSIPDGTYDVRVVLRDPNGYRDPMPLHNTGRQADGSYIIKTNVVFGEGGPPPVSGNWYFDSNANGGSEQDDAAGITLGMQFTVSDTLLAKEIRFWKVPAAAGNTHTALIYGTNPVPLYSGVFVGETASGWQYHAVSDSVLLVPGITYTVAFHTSGGDYYSTNLYFTSPATSGFISTPTSAGVYNYSGATPGKPELSYQSSNYWVDVYVEELAQEPPPPENIAPTANAGADQEITLPTNSISVSGSGIDTDGTIVSYLWAKIIGTGGSIVSPSSASTNITGLSEGVYLFRLTVTDDDGATGTDDITVTVNAAPPTPSLPSGIRRLYRINSRTVKLKR